MQSFLPGLDRRSFLKLLGGAVAGAGVEATPASQFNSADLHTLDRLMSCPTPADWARKASRGRWVLARHLALANRYAMKLAAREIKRLIVTEPPRHGKTSYWSRYVPSWWLGNFPEETVMLCSYGADLSSRWSGRARLDFEKFGYETFGIRVNSSKRAADSWGLDGYEGGMIAAGVGGPITGFGADLLIIDDPIKNAEEARSELKRENIWDWLGSTAYTRLEPDGVIVLIQTRWHQDDPVGRTIQDMENGGEHWEVLNLPAIAKEDEPPFPIGLGRKRGEALWPERYDLDTLATIRSKLTDYWWSALYDQDPTVSGGDIFRRTDFKIVGSHPPILSQVRFWDLAATEAKKGRDPDWVVGTRMGLGADGKYYVLNVRRFRKAAGEIEDEICQTAHADGRQVRVFLEQEPGAASKILIAGFVKRLAGYAVVGVKPEGSKEVRADALASQVQHGNVFLYQPGNADWILQFLDEMESFPTGSHDDICDSASGAYSKLVNAAPFRGVTSKPQGAHLDYQPR